MNIIQLRSLCTVVDCGLRISAAAEILHKSQPSISRQLKELEHELGVDIFLRTQNRILGITEAGAAILPIARKIVSEAENIQRIGLNHAKGSQGDLTIATTHTQARYTLPATIRSFIERFPEVQLSLLQADPTACCAMVVSGDADLAICAAESYDSEVLVGLPCYKLDRVIVAPSGHPLAKKVKPGLEDLAAYPLITYGHGYSGRSIIDNVFARNGLEPFICMTAIDADVSKTYVEIGLGVAILASVAFDRARDRDLRAIDARHLFPPSILKIIIRQNTFLRDYVYTFINTFAPHLGKRLVKEALFARQDALVTPEDVPDIPTPVPVTQRR